MTVLLKELLFDTIEVNKLPPRNTDNFRPHDEIICTKDNTKEYSFFCNVFNVEKEIWPYENDSFDVVIATEILEHLTRDPMHVFAEANRILKNGGTLLISTPNAVSLRNALKLFQGQTPNIAPCYKTTDLVNSR